MSQALDLKAVKDALLSLAGTISSTVKASGPFWSSLPANTALPSLVLDIVTGMPLYTMANSSVIEDITIQARIIADPNAGDDSAALLFNALDTAFNKANIAVTGYTTMILIRQGGLRWYTDHEGYENIIQHYQLMITK